MNRAFIYSYKTFISFATYEDVINRDSRVFEANEDLTVAEINDYLEQGSQRILSQIRTTPWWAQYQRNMAQITDPNLLPNVNPDYILARTQDFKDLNVFFTLWQYVYPKIADFGNPDSAEVQKIKFYKDLYNVLFDQVIKSGDWYDFSENGTIDTADKMATFVNRTRQR
jgi:hypothetical protein